MADGALLLLGIAGPELTPAEAALFRKLQPAGDILGERNLTSPAQARKLTDALRDLSTDTPIIALEQKGGRDSPLSRIAPSAPSPSVLAARGDLGKIADAGAFTGDPLRLLGINLNLAPTLDLDLPEDGQSRSWGNDPQRVIDRAGQWNRWLRKRSIATCAGDFPGRACGSDISGLLRRDIIPYTALMPEIDAVKTANLVFPNIDPQAPAALSTRIVRSFLRDQLGFDKHLVIAEHPQVTDSIRAGNDLVIIREPAGNADLLHAEISRLPHSITDDARVRLERFRRKKLHGPLKWSDDKWASSLASLGSLADEFQESQKGEIG